MNQTILTDDRKLTDPYEIFLSVAREIKSRQEFWRADLNKVARNKSILKGNLLSQKAKQQLKQLNVTPVERGIYDSMYQVFQDSLYRSSQTGRVKAIINMENSVDASTLDLLIKQLKTDIEFDYHVKQIVREGISLCFFAFLKVDIVDDDISKGRIALKHYSPTSVLPSKDYHNNAVNIDDVILIDVVDKDSLYIAFPDKKDEIDEWNKSYQTASNVYRSRDEYTKLVDDLSSCLSNTITEKVVLYTYLRPTVMTVKCFVDFASSNEIIVTGTWTEDDIIMFSETNPSYELVERVRYVLFETIVSNTGLVLRNRMCPIQIPKGSKDIQLCGALYVPELLAGKPSGFTDLIAQDLELMAISDSLTADHIFKTGGQTLFIERGAIDDTFDSDEIIDQLTSRFGIVQTTEGALQSNKLFVRNQETNPTINEYSKSIYDFMQEYSGARQELQGNMQSAGSNYRASTAIRQALSSKSIYIDNLTLFNERMTNILLYLYSIIVTNEDLVRVTTPNGEEQNIDINVVGYDEAGRLMRVFNDLRLGKFKYSITKQDSSDIDDQIEQESANEFMAQNGETLMNLYASNPKAMVVFMKSQPNSLLKQMGEKLEESLDAMQQQSPAMPEMPQNAQEVMPEEM